MAVVHGGGAWLGLLTFRPSQAHGALRGKASETTTTMAARTKSKVTPKYKTKYRVRNWSRYEESLRRRGDLTVWFDADAVDSWNARSTGRPGGQREYSDVPIETRALYDLSAPDTIPSGAFHATSKALRMTAPRNALWLLLSLSMLGCPPVGTADDDDAANDDDAADDDDAANDPITCAGDFSSTDIGDCNIIEGSVLLYGVASLTEVDGLSGLTSIGGALQLYGNNALVDIAGLSQLTSVAGGSNIYGNPALCQSAVDALIASCPACGIVSYANDEGC